MERKRLVARLKSYMTDPDVNGAEAYHFNIKMPGVRLPREMEEKLRPDEWWDLVRRTLTDALEMFADELKQNYKWISGWATEGRSDGWLVLLTDEPVFDDYGNLPPPDQGEGPKDWSPLAFAYAEKRLEDLDKIDKEVRAAKKMLLDDMKTQAFWGPEKYWKRS